MARTQCPGALFDAAISAGRACESFVKLNPRHMVRNPVMFVVEVGSVLTTIIFFRDLRRARPRTRTSSPGWSPLFLWFTVLFANFAEAVAEGRGKAQADTLRRTRQETVARARRADGRSSEVPGSAARRRRRRASCGRRGHPERRRRRRGHRQRRRVGDHRRVGAGHPRGRRRPLGGHRRARGCCRTGSSCASPRRPGETFIDRMIALVEGAERQKTPNEIALNILLAGLTIIFLLATVTLQPFAIYRRRGAERRSCWSRCSCA